MREELTPNMREIQLADLYEGQRNPRKIFRGIEALAESLKEHGQLQPILVRPCPPGIRKDAFDKRFEIVWGARRNRAAPLAGLTSLRAEVRELSDREALELSLVENDQREGVHPLEEAEGYRQLREVFGASEEQIAAAVGHTVGHVRQRLRLMQLCEAGRVLFFAGKLMIAGAFMVARLPSVELQNQLCEEISTLVDDPGGEETQAIDSWRIRKMIEARYLTDLTAAPWPKKTPMVDAKGVEVAPACSSCPKRTGNQRELFEEVSRDLCTDVVCFALKKRTHMELVQVRLKESGRTVFDAKTSRAYFLGGSASLTTSAPFHDLDAVFAMDSKGRTLRALLGKSIPAESIVGAIDGAGGVHELVPKDLIAAALAGAGHEQMAEGARRTLEPSAKVKAFESVEEEKAAVRRLMVASSLEVMTAAAARRTPGIEFWTVLTTALLGMVGGRALKAVCERRGLTFGKGSSPAACIGAVLASGNEQHARGLVLELAVMHGVQRGEPQAFEDGCLLFGVDEGKERAKARKALKLAPLGGRPPKAKKQRLEDLADDDEDEPSAPCCEVVRVHREGRTSTAAEGHTGFSTCAACEALGEQIEEVIAEGYIVVPTRTLLIDHVIEGGTGVVGEHSEARVLAVLAELERRGRVWADPKGKMHTHRRALKKRYVTHGAVRRQVG